MGPWPFAAGFVFLEPFSASGGFMNVWPEAGAGGRRALVTSEGELVSVSIAVKPHLLESVLEALAGLPFPVNPQIFHEGATVRVAVDGAREVKPATVVEFPAYASHLDQIRAAVKAAGLDPALVWTRSMLEQLHSEYEREAAPPGAPFKETLRYRRTLRV
jgi:hypothetical protein